MQKKYRLAWMLLGYLLLHWPCLNYAQNVYTNTAIAPSKNTKTTLPTPQTLSNDAFKAKVKAQNAAIQHSLRQDAKTETTNAMTANSQPLPKNPMTTQSDDNTDYMAAQPAVAPSSPPSPGAIEAPVSNPAATTFITPAPANNTQSTPAQQNTTTNKTQGGWQIQY